MKYIKFIGFFLASLLIGSLGYAGSTPTTANENLCKDDLLNKLNAEVTRLENLNNRNDSYHGAVIRTVGRTLNALTKEIGEPDGTAAVVRTTCENQIPGPGTWSSVCEICAGGECCVCTITSAGGPQDPCQCGPDD